MRIFATCIFIFVLIFSVFFFPTPSLQSHKWSFGLGWGVGGPQESGQEHSGPKQNVASRTREWGLPGLHTGELWAKATEGYCKTQSSSGSQLWWENGDFYSRTWHSGGEWQQACRCKAQHFPSDVHAINKPVISQSISKQFGEL